MNNDISTFNKSSDASYNYNRKLNRKTFRLLAKCEVDNFSNIAGLKENIPNNIVNKKRDMCVNEKEPKGEIKSSNRNLLNTFIRNKKDTKNKSCIFETKKYSRLENKIFKELDYMDFLKNNRTIGDKLYKKLTRKKLAIRLASPLILFLLLLIGLLLDAFAGCWFIRGLMKILKLSFKWNNWYIPLHDFLKNSPLGVLFKSNLITFKRCPLQRGYIYVENFFYYLIYCIPFLILGFAITLGIVYYHKKVKKYNEIKFRKR
ncbi:Plasmodium exported protein (Pm-fam-a like), unknown function [Plasmodium malariae]|uniref:Fam-l protein n=1 Tax=Plasmodium malariae TaxID=5858 RepID=A0A1A8X112_PLAMA|nr:Plasmodium exported protein (Pm-fam-a like), unknown function [Plasmodium malariae]